MTNREYNIGQQNYNLKIDGILFKQIEKYRQSKQYKSSTQAASELIKVGLNCIKEQDEDEYLLTLALEREKNDNGIRHSLEDVMKELGITQREIDEMEDVEIE